MNSIKKYIKKILVALASSIILIVTSYLYNNNPYPLLDDIDHYAWLEYIKQQIVKPDVADDSVVYINVAYEKKAIPFKDEYGMPVGTIDVTDREKIAYLLRILNKQPNYKYIFLDVRFEKGYEDNSIITTDDSILHTVDEVLFAEIRHTPRLVFATHEGMELISDSIEQNAVFSDYNSTITATNFVRYQYLKEDKYSAPLFIYNSATGHSIERIGFLYFDNGKLCHNCPFIRIPHAFGNTHDEVPYMNLSADILSQETGIGDDIIEVVKNKYVFIGDMVNDMHDTYVGMQPGTYISNVAMNALFRGEHIVNWIACTIIGIVYFLIALSLYTKVTITNYIPWIKKHDSFLMRFVLSFLGITFVMYFVTDINYLLTGATFCIWIPSVYFTIMKTIINAIKK